MIKSILILGGILALAGCERPAKQGENASGEEVADKLEDAADQSGPAAKQVLDEAADEARQHPSMEPVDKPGSFAQRAMQEAGDAEASTVPTSSPSSRPAVGQ